MRIGLLEEGGAFSGAIVMNEGQQSKKTMHAKNDVMRPSDPNPKLTKVRESQENALLSKFLCLLL